MSFLKNHLMLWVYISLTFLLSQEVQAWAGCQFTLGSSGDINCPAGQLPDGQIRLNGSEPTAAFSISDGQIWDSAGRGCIVTGPPTTQIQCDDGKAAEPGFSIDEHNVLSWKGSPYFSACPATDTEYNIYANPNFGQAKCFNVTLTASGCGSCSALPAITETVTVTATAIWTSTVTVTSMTCVPETTPLSFTTSVATAGCHKCNVTLSSASASFTWSTSTSSWW